MSRDQAHRIPPVPSNATFPCPCGCDKRWPVYWDRTDPGYDQPGPPRRSDLSWQLVIEGAVVFAVIVLFVVLASLVAVEP